jgi:replication-associated recombination protein RarA
MMLGTQYLKQDAPLATPSQWWITLSNLQKAIRRGNLAQATLSANLLYRTDRAKLIRRMAVIALEDVGFGNLRLVSCSVNNWHMSCIAFRYLCDRRYRDGDGTTEGRAGAD